MKAIRYLLIYIISIFFFGAFYWGYWFFHPDSFIIEEQFNLHPFSSAAILGDNLFTLSYYQKKADSLRAKSDSDRIKLKKMLFISDSLKPLANAAINELEKRQWVNVDKWREAQIPDSLKTKLEDIEAGIKLLNQQNPNQPALPELNLEKVKLELEISKIKVKSNDFIFSHLEYFQDSSLKTNFHFLDSAYSNYRFRLIPKQETDLRLVEAGIDQLKYDALNSFNRRISFLDFLLFSASNSSTVTYGEIIPNDTVIRLTLFLQAITCIVLIAISTEALIKKLVP